MLPEHVREKCKKPEELEYSNFLSWLSFWPKNLKQENVSFSYKSKDGSELPNFEEIEKKVEEEIMNGNNESLKEFIKK